MNVKNNQLYFDGLSAEELIKKYKTPLYVYEAEVIRRQYNSLAKNISYPHTKIHYAAKANANPAILKIIRQLGGNIEAVSKGKILSAFKAGFKPGQIIYTCNGAEEEELRFVIDNDITANLDSLNQIETWGRLNPNSSISLRLNLDIGAGSHIYITTGGRRSKFGIHISKIKEAKKLAKKYGLRIVGLHQHIGSDVVDGKVFGKAMRTLLKIASQFPELEFVNFGGGFGIPYKPDQKPLDTKTLGDQITKIMNQFTKEYGKEINVIIEPGRYLVAQAGTLLTSVTDIKSNPSRTFVSTNTGFNHMIRSAMYFAYHNVTNASRVEGKKKTVTVVGNICESADIFAQDRVITNPKKGDILAIHDTGAYGYTMSSLYNARVKPAEVLIDNGKAKLIRERLNIENILDSI
ncbi:diaminopimelate decarboxylase [Patescibacteria group bacterium]|nr:diaminopimelate decarboxylase [Patescibacteria group bacterium]